LIVECRRASGRWIEEDGMTPEEQRQLVDDHYSLTPPAILRRLQDY
jgi:hypothetical protein